MDITTKVCTMCKIEKDISCFYKHVNTKSGFHSECKECTKIYRNNHKKEQSDYFKKYHMNVARNYCMPGMDVNIENYELAKADNFIGWDRHHRLETHTSDGELRIVQLGKEELNALGMYYNRPPEELVFLRKSDHTKLHGKKLEGA